MKIRNASIAFITAGLCVTSAADTFEFTATINGAQENPPTNSIATGTLTGTYDDVANTFTFSWVITDNLSGTPTAGAHIHAGAVGTNGGVVFGFNGAGGVWPLSGSATWTNISAANVTALFNGGLYANFHTSAFGGGEIRGQILPVPEPCLPDVNGDGMLTPADFTAWINAFNNADPGCDQNQDGMCTPSDFTAWIANFNAGC